MDKESLEQRRRFLISSVTLAASTMIPAAAFGDEEKEVEVGPAEDLMREHGALNRILLIYEEGSRRLSAKEKLDFSVLNKSADIIKSFIEDYHEKLEEEFIFPRMRKAKKLVDLVDTLEVQHKAGRKLTATIEQLTKRPRLNVEADRKKLNEAIKMFISMYRPHESREDTILFPAFHEMLKEDEYEKLGEQFEDRERKLFGKDGFEGVVKKIEELEKAYDIYDLSKFTPNV